MLSILKRFSKQDPITSDAVLAKWMLGKHLQRSNALALSNTQGNIVVDGTAHKKHKECYKMGLQHDENARVTNQPPKSHIQPRGIYEAV